MGGAQPLAATMNGAALPRGGGRPGAGPAPRRAPATSMPSPATSTMPLAQLEAARSPAPGPLGGGDRERRRGLPGAGSPGRAPDLVTDQTSAHDPLNGYIPAGMTLAEAAELRRSRSRGARSPGPGLDGGASAGDAGDEGPGQPRLRLRQQPPCRRPGGGPEERLRLSRLRPGIHPAAVLRGPGSLSLGGALRRSGGHPPHRPRGAGALPGEGGRCGAGSRWPRSEWPSRACRRASAGWATASAIGPAWPSTSWCGRAR